MVNEAMQEKGTSWRAMVHFLQGSAEVVAAYLFGSQAQGTSDHLSDIDLAVLLRRELPTARMWRLEESLAVEVGRLLETERLDLFVLNTMPLAARFEVLRTGKMLLSNDEEQRTDFEVETMTEWWDFRKYDELYDRCLLARIKEGFDDGEREQYQQALATPG